MCCDVSGDDAPRAIHLNSSRLRPVLLLIGPELTDRLGPGRVELNSTLELPRGYDLVFKPGLELMFGDKVSLLGYGKFTSIGTAEHLVRIGGSGGTPTWGGVALQGTRVRPVRVKMEHTIFEGGVGSQNRRTYFTGPFAVHGGVVSMRNCRFLNSKTEDGINLKHCRVQLHGNTFSGSSSDAVDLDFCDGDVIGNRIEAGGGDGLDVSGAKITLAQNCITRCADKGISIGEAGDAVARNNYITHCYTGVAVKDLSKGLIADTGIAHVEIGVALYVKKPSFGPSTAKVRRVVMYHVATPFLCDPACELEQTSSIRYHSKGLPGADGTIPIETRKVDAITSPAKLKTLLTASTPDGIGIHDSRQIPW